MTSNFNYDELEHHLSFTQRGEKEVVKAGTNYGTNSSADYSYFTPREKLER